MTQEYVLELPIRDTIPQLSDLAKKIIEKINSYQDPITRDNLRSILKSLDSFNKIEEIFKKTALIGRKMPVVAMQVLNLYLPRISLNSNNLPQSNIFLQYIQNINWNNISHRYVIAIFVEIVLAIFCFKLIEQNYQQKEESLIYFFNQVNFIFDSEIEDVNFLHFRTITAKIWAKTLYHISKTKIWKVVYEQAMSKFKDVLDNNHKLLFFITYSKIYINANDTKIDSAFIRGLIKSANKVKNNTELYIAQYKFTINFIGNACISSSIFRESKELFEIYKILRKTLSPSSTEIGYECFALVITMIKRKDFNIKENINKLLNLISKQEFSYYLLRSLNTILRGVNYKGIYYNGEQYAGPRVIKDTDTIFQIFEAVFKNSANFAPFQNIMTEFIGQIAISDINNFIKVIIPEYIFTENRGKISSDFLKNNGEAVFDAARIFLHPSYDFPISDEQRKSLINIFQRYSLSLAADLHPTSPENWKKIEPKITVYSMKSFVQSIISHKFDIKWAFYYNQNESEPTPYLFYNSKPIFQLINKWKKLFPSDFSKDTIFKTHDFKLKNYNDDLVESPIYISAICAIPLASPDTMTINDLSDTVFAESAYVSSASIRSIQAIIQVNDSPTITESIFNMMDMIISKNLISSNEIIYRVLLLVLMILDSLLYKKITIVSHLINLINTCIVAGICSPSFDLRLLAIKIGNLLNGKINATSVTEAFSGKYCDDISHQTKISILSSIAYKDYTSLEILSIKPFCLMQSNYQYLYQFQIASFGYMLQFLLENDDLDNIRKKLIHVILSQQSKKQYTEPFLILNLIIFLFNSCKTSEFPELFDLLKLFQYNISKLQSSNPDLIIDYPFYALFAKLNSDVLLRLISKITKSKQIKYKKMLLPILFSLRHRVDEKAITISDENVSPILLLLELIIGLFKDDINIHTLTISNKPKSSNQFSFEEKKSLISFLQFSRLIFFYLYHEHQNDPVGPFLRIPYFSMEMTLNLNVEMWFLFITNLTVIDSEQSEICQEARKTLVLFFKVFTFPESYFNDFADNILKFECEPEIITGFINYCIERLPLVIEGAQNISLSTIHSSFAFFRAISFLFKNFSTIDSFLSESEKCFKFSPSEKDLRFHNIIYKNCGKLLALAFYYILKSDPQGREAGFRVLQSISLGLALSRSNFSDKLCHYLDAIRSHIITSQHANTGLYACISLSKLLSNEFSFISEQFVSSSLPLITYVKNISDIILPWIRNIRFSTSNLSVFTLTESAFLSFSTYSFVEALIEMEISPEILQIISKIVESQIEESFDVIDYFLITILKSSDRGEGYKALIVFLYTLNPEHVLEILFSVLKYDFWHYRQVQYDKFDAFFDISKFLFDASSNESKPEKTSSSNTKCNLRKTRFIKSTSVNDDESENDAYDTTIHFVLNTLLLCLNEKEEPFQPFIPDFILFSFIHIKENTQDPKSFFFSQYCKSLLVSLLPFEIDNDLMLHQYIDSLDYQKKEKLSIQSLSWGLCCGNFDIALNGLTFFNLIGLEKTNEIIDKILISIYIATQCLYEQTNNIQNSFSKQKQWLFQILDIEKEPNKKFTSEYIATLLDMISNSNPREDVFWTAVSLLNNLGEEYTIILNSSIKLITQMLKSRSFSLYIIERITSSKNSESIINHSNQLNSTNSQSYNLNQFKGLIPMISQCTFDKDTPHLFFNLFQELKGDKLTIGYNVSDPNPLFDAIDTIVQIIEFEKSDLLISNFNIKKYSMNDVDILLKLLTQMILNMKDQNLSLIYEMCALIINENGSNQLTSFSDIASAAQTDKNFNNFFSINSLLKAIYRNGGTIIPRKRTFHSSFPKAFFCKTYNFNVTRESNVTSVFSDVKTFPPPLPNDTGFILCPIVSSIKSNVEQVRAQPFSEWADIMFKSSSVEINLDTDEIFPINTISANEIKEWSHKIAIFNGGDDEYPILYNIISPDKILKHIESNEMDKKSSKNTLESELLIDLEIFMPSNEDIDLIGNDSLFQGYTMPSIFPK